MRILDMIRNRNRKIQPGSVKNDFIAFLKNCNCTYRLEEEPDECQTRVFFDYQAGHFIAVVKDSNVGVEVNFPSFADMPVSEVQLVRSMCNKANSQSTVLKYVYTFDEDDSKLRVHLSFFCNVVIDEQMTFLLNSCFFFQRDFLDDYKQAKENQERHSTDDLEFSFEQMRRERHLLAMQEMRHDATSGFEGWRGNDTKHLMLGDFMEKAVGITGFPRGMTVMRNGAVEVVEAEDLRQWDLTRLLVTGQGADAVLAHSDAVAVVSLLEMNAEQQDERERILTITAQAEGSDEKSLYMRVTACLSALPVSRTNSLAGNHPPKAVSVLMAYDKADNEQRQQEFDYMWMDARLRIRDGEELSEQQQLIYDIARANIAYNLYWGKSLMLDKRYFEALLHFENAYRDLLPEFFQLNEHLRNTFMDICYYIGFCYMEMRQYEKAFYYLQFFDNDQSVRRVSEWVNCLTNSQDIRVFKAIDETLAALADQYKKADEVPEFLQEFVNFLRRRRAYALIDFNDLDEAEKAFKEMLEDPDNSDYAMGELAHIARLREQRGETDAEKDAPSDSKPTDGEED